MEQIEKEYTLSLYNNLSALRNSPKSSVYLVKNELNGKIYIKKELKTYNIEVFRALKKISHRNTPRVYEFIELENTLYVIEEFINGNTLEEVLEEQGTLEEHRVIEYVLELCDILNVLHNEKVPIIHRDIKPSNIIISNDNVLKLIDFDVSRIYKEEGNKDTYILGTEGYASPEQCGFDQTDCRSDIYSLGILMNVLTTGDYPKNRKNSGNLSKIIEKCTHIAAEKRYENVIELSDELKKIREHNEIGYSGDYNEGARKGNGFVKGKKLSVKSVEDDKVQLKEEVSDRKDNKFIRLVKQLPGFRSGHPLKIIIAFCGYFFMLAGILISFYEFNIISFLENISLVLMLLSMTFLTTNFKDIQKKLPIVRSSNVFKVIVGLAIYNFILFMVGGMLLISWGKLR